MIRFGSFRFSSLFSSSVHHCLRENHTPPSSTTTTSTTDPLISLLNQCSTLNHINQAHGFMVPRGLDQNTVLLSKFVETCIFLGFKDNAYSVFSHKKQPDIYLWNTMIKCLSQTDSARDAVLLYNRIQDVGLRPDTYSFPFVLKACAHLSKVKEGKAIHGQVVRIGLDSDVHVETGLIHMYSACGSIEDARHLFDEMPRRDVVSWNAMVAGYAKLGDVDSARMLFDQMPERNVISWTAVIAGYSQLERPNEAITLFRKMQLADVEPDEITMLTVLSACAHLGALELGEWIHNYIDKHRLYRIVPLMNALIDMYAKSGNIDKALQVFHEMHKKSVITWTTMIAGLALHGLGSKALEVFSQMERAKIKPNDVTFIAILSACSHIGFVDAGLWHFNSMSSTYKIMPKIEHYGCVVDLLGRAGLLQEAQEVVRNMPFEANAKIWGALLAAAKVHANVELGEIALRHLIEVEPHNSGNYILLSNIYASLGKWDDVGMVRTLMRDRGVQKTPGGSSVEVNNTVHEFIVGDRSHPQFKRIYQVLYEINKQLKMVGYVPKVNGGLLDLDEG